MSMDIYLVMITSSMLWYKHNLRDYMEILDFYLSNLTLQMTIINCCTNMQRLTLTDTSNPETRTTSHWKQHWSAIASEGNWGMDRDLELGPKWDFNLSGISSCGVILPVTCILDLDREFSVTRDQVCQPWSSGSRFQEQNFWQEAICSQCWGITQEDFSHLHPNNLMQIISFDVWKKSHAN